MTEYKEKLHAAAQRANKTGMATTLFMAPEALGYLRGIAQEYGLLTDYFGGYEDAERQVICFYEKGDYPSYPISCISIEAKTAMEHRQVLGSTLALGLSRELLGDIVLDDKQAYLFCMDNMAFHIADNLLSVGKQHVTCKVLDTLPALQQKQGDVKRVTLASPRLDAVLSAALHLSRGDAALLLQQRKVYVNHSLCEKPDKRIAPADVLSVRGFGRLLIQDIGAPTKKGRIPMMIEQFLKTKNKR